jgi:hypothetical protein
MVQYFKTHPYMLFGCVYIYFILFSHFQIQLTSHRHQQVGNELFSVFYKSEKESNPYFLLLMNYFPFHWSRNKQNLSKIKCRKEIFSCYLYIFMF